MTEAQLYIVFIMLPVMVGGLAILVMAGVCVMRNHVTSLHQQQAKYLQDQLKRLTGHIVPLPGDLKEKVKSKGKSRAWIPSKDFDYVAKGKLVDDFAVGKSGNIDMFD